MSLPRSEFIIYIRLTFPIKEPDKFKIKTNAKPEHVGDLIGEFVRCQLGQGEDKSPASELDEYHIDISIDLTDDTWSSSHDTGNLGLRDGILMDVMQRINGRKGIIDWIFDDELHGCKTPANISSSHTSEPPTSSG
jgi:hypothetical protein